MRSFLVSFHWAIYINTLEASPTIITRLPPDARRSIYLTYLIYLPGSSSLFLQVKPHSLRGGNNPIQLSLPVWGYIITPGMW